MNLNELQENNRTKLAQRALKEHYDFNIKLEKLDAKSTREMLLKVRTTMKEARKSRQLSESHQNPAYLKMLMMEQLLSSHYTTLRMSPDNIVVENEEVDKATVILSAQEFIDEVQKMTEQVSAMNVEDLPKIVSQMQSDIGPSEAQQFNSTVGQTLTELQASLTKAKQALDGALGSITGQGGAETGEELGSEIGGEIGADLGSELGGDLGADLGGKGEEGGMEELHDLGDEEQEPEGGPAGRERR
jgi:hypothetical protein